MSVTATAPAAVAAGPSIAGRIGLWGVGLVVLSCGIAATIWSTWGVGSIDSTITGLARTTGVPIWAATLVINVFLVGSATLAGERLRAGTVVCGAAMGPIIGVALSSYGTSPHGYGRAAACLVGITCIGVGAACQISAALGPSPLDTFMCAVTSRIGGLRRSRTLIECVFIVAGLSLGGQIGWGTAVSAAATGAVIAAALRTLAPLRRRLGT